MADTYSTAFWKEVTDAIPGNERRLRFHKTADAFDDSCADRLGALTVDRQTPGISCRRSISARPPS